MTTAATTTAATLNDSVLDRLLHERIVVVGQEIDDPVANRVVAQLLLLAAEDPTRDITLDVDSPGGSVSAGFAVHDTMLAVEPDVCTVATGMAASMGQFLLTAGTPGKRRTLPRAQIMMHQPSGGVGGAESDIAIRADMVVRRKQPIAEITAEHTGQPVDQGTADLDRDRWFTASEAVEYGLVDRIVARQGG